MVAITATHAREKLLSLIRAVNEDHTPVEIVSQHGNPVLVSEEEWGTIEETAYLLRSPANAQWLMRSLENAQHGNVTEHELDHS